MISASVVIVESKSTQNIHSHKTEKIWCMEHFDIDSTDNNENIN